MQSAHRDRHACPSRGRNTSARSKIGGRRRHHRPHRLHRRAALLRALRAGEHAGGDVGRAGRRGRRRPSGWAPATPCAWRRPCPSTATSWESTPTASRSRSTPARWPASPSASRRSRATSSAARRWPASARPTAGSCARDFSDIEALPRVVRPFRLLDRGRRPRRERRVFRGRPPGRLRDERHRGALLDLAGEGLATSSPTRSESGPSPWPPRRRRGRGRRRRGRRPRQPRRGRGRPYHLRSDAPPFCRPIVVRRTSPSGAARSRRSRAATRARRPAAPGRSTTHAGASGSAST